MLSFFDCGGRAQICFYALEPRASKPQPQYFGLFGSSDVTSQSIEYRVPPFADDPFYPGALLAPGPLYNLAEDELVSHRRTVLYDPDRPTHTSGEGLGTDTDHR